MKHVLEFLRRVFDEDGLRHAAGSAFLAFVVTLILEDLPRALTTGAVVFLVVYFISHIG
jgi:hypothetical protein